MYDTPRIVDKELRKEFYLDLDRLPFDVLSKKYFPMPTFKSKILKKNVSK